MNSFDEQKWINYIPLSALITGVVVLGIYAISTSQGLVVFSTAVMVAIASAAIGAFLGFLFGIPRTYQNIENSEVSAQRLYGANTNLEGISDWLTKILVGVSLTQLVNLSTYIYNLGQFLKPSLGGDDKAAIIGSITVIYFISISFLFSYLLTRLRMEEALQRTDQRIKDFLVKKITDSNEFDAKLQSLVHDLLNSQKTEIERITQSEIDNIFAKATLPARLAAFGQAWDIRSESWENDKQRMERTIPIFRALVKCNTDKQEHRFWGNLAWALKDKVNPSLTELQEARDALIKAIMARGEISQGYPHYELSRAIVNIKLDNDFQQNKASSADTQTLVLGDLAQVGRYDASWYDEMKDIPEIKNWLKLNSFDIDTVKNRP
jgi:hypothetical protein